jgi:SAM-dependent methyltransferase
MYDDFSADYDRFVNWSARLALELPFIQRQLEAVGARRVLDAACGTGMHALALAERGYEVLGTDLSAGMIERARANAQAAGLKARFVVAGLGELRQQVGDDSVPGQGGLDAVLCLGNSLPHLLTPADLQRALSDFAACLRPGGLLLLQNRNFDAVLARQDWQMSPQSHREGEAEWLFARFYDPRVDGTLTFHVLNLRREGADPWQQQVISTRLWPMQQNELIAALQATNWANITSYGDMNGSPFDPEHSGNLIITARRA